jgi:hypothetical protein
VVHAHAEDRGEVVFGWGRDDDALRPGVQVPLSAQAGLVLAWIYRCSCRCIGDRIDRTDVRQSHVRFYTLYIL